MIFNPRIIAVPLVFLVSAGTSYAKPSMPARQPVAAQSVSSGEGAQQELSDFSIDYGERGKKSWDLSGKSANVFESVVQLNNITGNLYNPTDKVTLTAKNGDFNKSEGKVHLQDDVVITTQSGAKLTTDSLDWDSKKQLVMTKDKVNIEKDIMTTSGVGAQGEPGLNKMTLQKDVTVKIHEAPDKSPEKAGIGQVIISCDGPLEIDYQGNVAIFRNNVKADKQDSVIYCDTMEVHFTREPQAKSPAKDGGKEPGKAPAKEIMPGIGQAAGKVTKIDCKGHVRIVKGDNISYSEEAVYSSADQKIMLTGRPKLVITSMDDLKSFGPQ